MARRLRPTPPHVPDFKSVAQTLRHVANETLLREVKAYADREREQFVHKIDTQAFPSFQEVFYPESGTNLSPKWLARKERKGRDLRTMIATGWYKTNIKTFTRKARRKGEPTLVRVGFDYRTRARDLDGHITDVPLWLVAVYQEHGSIDGKLPARPHWRPHLDSMRAKSMRTRRSIRERVKQALRTDRGLKRLVVVR